MSEQGREVSGEFISSTDSEELLNAIEQGTLQTAKNGGLPAFTAPEIANNYNEGQHSPNTIRKHLEKLRDNGSIVMMEVGRHSEQPTQLWFSPAVKFSIKKKDFEQTA